MIVVSRKEMISYLNEKNSIQFWIDCTFKIIPSSYKPYKLMAIYSKGNKDNKITIGATNNKI